ncbi:MAG: helix-turn-helix transcriptional regulator [Oceanibaculum nanhaiense]|jgi:transcriptional regulator with XRE-family HTH domain|uniref:helix-turn-helix domain-containing protein n=1 Tax=Oceanibaculum nanhaiense TaxID=1909734 RepID=UPI0032EB0668
MNRENATIGPLLRDWRMRRRLSQLALASEAEISQRHLSFVESGRAAPSREMVLHLAEHLAVPLRDRNRLLLAAGYAPAYPDRPLGDPGLAAARQAVELILTGHEPHPALALDRHWHLVSANRAVTPLLDGVTPALLAPPVNVLRLSLHPDGLAPRIGNFREWRAHILARLAHQIDASADPALITLLEELKSYPIPPGAKPYRPASETGHGGIAVPLILITGHGTLSFISTTTIFGTALDIALSELAIESFFPADSETALAMRSLLD